MIRLGMKREVPEAHEHLQKCPGQTNVKCSDFLLESQTGKNPECPPTEEQMAYSTWNAME